MMGGMATGIGMVIDMDIIDRDVGIIHPNNTRAILNMGSYRESP